MSQTLYGAVKAYLEAQGLGISVYRDAAPSAAKPPYCVLMEDITLSLHPLEDGATSTGVEEVQLDLYQQWRDSGDKPAESATLADAITQKLHGAQLGTGTDAPPKRVYGILQRGRPRLPNRDSRLVRHTFLLDIIRSI